MKTKDSGGSDRVSLYTQVTDRIIAELETGRLPWVQPWDSAKASARLPRNAGTGRAYSGINVLILWATVIERGYGRQAWLTYKQCKALSGHVRQGEQGTTICYADRFIPKAEQARAAEQDDDTRQVSFLKRFTVFNVDQCDNLPATLAGHVEPLAAREVIPHAEALIDATGADLRIGGDRAFYAPSADFIAVPPPQAYHHAVDWYRTTFHELGHNAAYRIMPTESFKNAEFSSSADCAYGIIFARLAIGSRAIFGARRLQSEIADLKTLNMSGFLLARRTRPRSDRADRAGKGIGIMPSARTGDPAESAFLARHSA